VARKAASLELAVLGLLHESPLHGYELRKRLNLLLGWGRLLSYGSLYPALKRLLRAGSITEVTATAPGVSRRQRIVYQITPAGREFFGEQMTDAGPAAWEDDTFTMRFAFFSRTDADVRLRVLEGRLSRLQERLDRAQHSSRGGAGDDRYLSELRRHSIESVEREVAWLTDLITAERTGERTAELPSTTSGSAVEAIPDSTDLTTSDTSTTTTSAAPPADATTGNTR
jgi:DNA-binding PadR family transcriptional regulator